MNGGPKAVPRFLRTVLAYSRHRKVSQMSESTVLTCRLLLTSNVRIRPKRQVVLVPQRFFGSTFYILPRVNY